ncbi:MAG: organic solvent tolerance protein [Bdellovibrionaceae bacterium]|nr:organic solvent tolerance protein [Pseudobdellovibrionaceae bacterium]
MARCQLLVFLLFLVFAPLSEAKNLMQRLGIGPKNNSSFEMPALGAVYYPNSDYGLTGGVGVDTARNNSKFSLNVGLRRIIFQEDNMNFFFGGALGLVNYESAGDKQSGFELNLVFGMEFFLPGLENLGFNVESGVGIASLRDVRFRTLADDPFRAGIIFYF